MFARFPDARRAGPMTAHLRAALDAGPMNRFQWGAVAVCVVLNMLDGFDVLVMSFTGRSVSQEWGLRPTELGLLLSAGLVGMAAGALFVAPWADRIGRRPMILGALVVSGTGMLLSALSQSAVQLGALRALTGVGIGTIIAGSNVIAGEYASRRWRGLAVTLNSAGYAIGATLGGLIAVGLLDTHGWRSVFLLGGIATLAAVPLVAVGLPESLDFLVARRPPRALESINTLARRLGQPPLERLPEAPTPTAGVAAGFRELLSPRLRRPTLTLWAAFFLTMAGFYFVTSWTPTLLVEAGLSGSQGLTGGTLLNLGGIFGATAIGALAARYALRSVLMAYLAVTAVGLAAFVAATSSLAAAFVLGAVIGVTANGCVAGLYALTAVVYEPRIRATGVGTAIGIGRIGAILAPTVAGGLLDGGWTPQQLYLAVGVVYVATAALLPALRTGRPAAHPGAATTDGAREAPKAGETLTAPTARPESP
ncbi:MFS transporter [Allostreptomyces psammosilenae]|uniref:Benzoate transport n=1 Tax=Allostreptomyces psammosilenae TaxID=1892865 RepID=A0A853A980_9ACTN|nr:MFS transporter [Allostreptomyces psammosilenae]NYI06972.1 benzoate transport [Allostreptomyces psammosilenae]